MPGLPVVCELCGQIFEHPNFIVGGVGLTINADEGARIGPHPGCGGYGRIAAGTYKFASEGVRVVFRSQLPAADLRAIVALLERAHGATTAEDLEAELQSAPPWLAKLLDENSALGTKRFRITVLLAILSIAVSVGGTAYSVRRGDVAPPPATVQTEAPEPLRDQDVERIAREVVDELERKLGRNDPCWCGSDQKFKKCHGSPAAHAP